ncbi:MAG: hypothetical protein AAB505_00380, partial [Patescibacteria group bacterium]
NLWLTVGEWWQKILANADYLFKQISFGWRKFLGQEKSSTTTPVFDPALIEQLKAEIKLELARELSSAPATRAAGPATGLVVVPSSGNATADRFLVEELEKSFSDQVEIKFESSGQTGVITPVFSGGRGEDYLFVITPIRRAPAAP